MSGVKFRLDRKVSDAEEDGESLQDIIYDSDSVSSIPVDRKEVALMQTQIILVALNMCIDELSVLELLYNENRIPTSKVAYENLFERYGCKEREQERKYLYRIGNTYSNYKKLQKDILMIVDILKGASNEIYHTETYIYMEESVDTLELLYHEEESLLQTEARNYKLMHDLKNELIRTRKLGRQSIDELNKKINNVQKQYDSVLAYVEEEIKYIQKWENSRMEQKFMMLEQIEKHYGDVVKNTQKQMRNERRVHYEITDFVVTLENEHKMETEQWIKDYERECEKRDEQIFQLRIELENNKDNKIRLTTLWDKRVKDMTDWIEYKTKKVAARKRYILEFHSAFVIQRWWRRVLQIRGFGKGKKKKGKGDKKGKKK